MSAHQIPATSGFQQIKADLHKKILDRLDLEKLGKGSSDAMRGEVLTIIRNEIAAEAVPLSFTEIERASCRERV